MIHLPRHTGVVLDLDDTLYGEREYQVSGFRSVVRLVMGRDDGPLLNLMLQEGLRGGDPLGLAAAHGDYGVAELLEHYRGHKPAIGLYPDARRLLDRVSAVGRPPVVVTDGRSVTQWNKVQALGLARWVAGVIVSEDVGVSKPDPEIFRRAAALMDAQGFVYIADNPAKDFVAPNGMGWKTIMLRSRGRNVHPQDVAVAASFRAQWEVRSLDEVIHS